MFPAQTAVALESRGIKLTWFASETTSVVGYEVYMSIGDNTNFRKINKSLIPETKFLTPELAVGQSYFFKIRAVDNYGNFSDSEEFKIYIK